MQDILTLEKLGWKALSATKKDGVAFYRDMLTSDAVMIFPGGILLLGRDSILDAIDAQPWASFEITDANERILSDTVRLLVYKVTAQRSEANPYHATISSTYVLKDGAWKLALHQQSTA